MTRWWLSFCDPDAPKGSQFIGVCVVCGDTFEAAVMLSHVLGINPGGEVAGFLVPDIARIHDDDMNRLHRGRPAVEALDRRLSDLNGVKGGLVEPNLDGLVCEECNEENKP